MRIGFAGALLLFSSDHVLAHGFAGARFFPATLASDDPFVADELSVPTASFFKDGDDVATESYSVDLAKRITRDFGIELGESYFNLRPSGGPAASGFDNLSIGTKYQVAIDPMHESIFAIGVMPTSAERAKGVSAPRASAPSRRH
jgi:hypothetical protein